MFTSDLNNDGAWDILTANYTFGGQTATVSVLLGNGDGTFRPAMNYRVGRNAHAVTVGDFDGDGNIDLAVANHGSNSTSVLLGNGDGTFQTAIDFPVGSGPYWIGAGDFNGDGAPDLATANGASNNISILLNARGGQPSPRGGQPGISPDGLAVLQPPTPANGQHRMDRVLEAFYLEEVAPHERDLRVPPPTSELVSALLRFRDDFENLAESEIPEAFSFVSALESALR
jgi:hypothetical protein